DDPRPLAPGPGSLEPGDQVLKSVPVRVPNLAKIARGHRRNPPRQNAGPDAIGTPRPGPPRHTLQGVGRTPRSQGVGAWRFQGRREVPFGRRFFGIFERNVSDSGPVWPYAFWKGIKEVRRPSRTPIGADWRPMGGTHPS